MIYPFRRFEEVKYTTALIADAMTVFGCQYCVVDAMTDCGNAFAARHTAGRQHAPAFKVREIPVRPVLALRFSCEVWGIAGLP